MHRFAHGIVTTEGEGNIGQAAASTGTRAAFFDFLHRFDKVDSIVVMLLHAGGDGEDIEVKNNVLRIHAHLFGENFKRALGDCDLVVLGRCLAFFIKRHDDDRGAVAHDFTSLRTEFVFAALKADRVDDTFPLDAFQTCFDHRPFRAVDHDRYFANIRFRRDQVEEAGHAGFAIEHPFVEINIDDLRTLIDLRLHDRQRTGKVVGFN